MAQELRGEKVSVAADDQVIAVSCLPGYTDEEFTAATAGLHPSTLAAHGAEDDGTEWFIFHKDVEALSA